MKTITFVALFHDNFELFECNYEPNGPKNWEKTQRILNYINTIIPWPCVHDKHTRPYKSSYVISQKINHMLYNSNLH